MSSSGRRAQIEWSQVGYIVLTLFAVFVIGYLITHPPDALLNMLHRLLRWFQ
jgi:hypothetical protein